MEVLRFHLYLNKFKMACQSKKYQKRTVFAFDVFFCYYPYAFGAGFLEPYTFS